jgi:hypothetical protein
LVSDVRGGETLKHFRFQPGDVVVADRGYAHPQGMSTAVQQGAALIVRFNPFSGVLTTLTGQPLSLRAALQRQQSETVRTLPRVVSSADSGREASEWHRPRTSDAATPSWCGAWAIRHGSTPSA